MAKKVTLAIGITIGAGLFLLLCFLNSNSFLLSTKRLTEILNPSTLKNFFENYNEASKNIYNESINEIDEAIGGFIESIQQTTSKSFGEILLDLLYNLMDFLFNFIIYFCNYGLNGLLLSYIILHETFSGTQESIKTSPLAYFYWNLSKLLTKIKRLLLKALKYLKTKLYTNRRKIALGFILLFLSTGFLYKIFVEFLIFIIVYIVRMIHLETYIVVFGMVESLFIFTYPKLKYIPYWIWIPLLLTLLFLKAVSKATYKLKKNHGRLKDFASLDLTQTTFINGASGTGKTLLNVSLALASEENYIEELEQKLLDYEMKYKYLNFAKVREHPEQYKEHQEYITTYELLNNRCTFLISNYAIYSPLFNQYSKIFNFDNMRVNKPALTYPLEEYIILSISEFDKEYNSHDNKKEVGEDGAATFFSTISHDLKRHVKIFVDYQLMDQVPLRIRGNEEYFLTIKKREKKFPLLLYLYYLPILGLNKLTKHFIKSYEQKKKTITKKSMRKSKAKFKRNDITLPYAILRDMAYSLKKLCDWFDSFYYFKLTVILSQEGDTKGSKKKLCINIRDLSYNNQQLYDSTFLSYSYSQKKNQDFKNIDTFTKLTPPQEELNKCNSRFYNKINN